MKLIKYVFVLISVFSFMSCASAKNNPSKNIKKKAVKEARKEAKELKKQGYYVSPGSLPLDKQLQDAWTSGYSGLY
jgi:hypothetical protein